MANRCAFCEAEGIQTHVLILKSVEDWVEFCEPCGEKVGCVDTVTGEKSTLSEAFRKAQAERKITE